jgi:hypothetical protein
VRVRFRPGTVLRRGGRARDLRKLVWTNVNVVVPNSQASRLLMWKCPVPSLSVLRSPNILVTGRVKGIPVCLIFSGASFYADVAGALRITDI